MATILTRKIGATLRYLKREILGESNRVQMVPEDYIPLRFFKAYANFYRHVSSAPALENRLVFAASQPVISGADADVHNVRCLDHVIGKIADPFNAAAKTTIEKHLADIEDSLARVTAVDADGKPVREIAYARDGKTFLTLKVGA